MKFFTSCRYSSFCLLPVLLLLAPATFAQSGLCDPNVPFFSVNLQGNPNGTWVSSPPVPRAGNCCGTSAPDKCIEFSILLDPLAVSINFQIASGAVPPGAMYYQLGCGPPVQVGEPICVNGPGPHVITFCKPGNNQNTYAITSISAPVVSPDVATSEGCNVVMGSAGIELTSITWTSIFPGTQGQYDNFLSCTAGCDTTVVTPTGTGYPAYVDYQICGIPTAGPCAGSSLFCDTVRAYLVPPILNTINPNPASFCANNPGVLLSGNINGGAPPYTITWFNGPAGTGTPVGTGTTYNALTPGTYSMEVIDSTYPGCPAKYTDVTVTETPVPLVNAGPDLTVCANAGSIPLSGTVINAGGGKWSGGSGTFSPSDSVLNATYTPTAAEIAAGTVTLTLTTTGNGSCAPVTDQVTFSITTPLTAYIDPPLFCFGATATISAVVAGGTAPYSYLWSTGDTTVSLSGVPAGTYSVQVTDNSDVSCSITATVNLVENPPLTLTVPSNSIISCDSLAVLTVSASAGGGGPYSYLWSTGDTTNTVSVTAGTYIIVASDTFGCTVADTIVITSPSISLSAIVASPGPVCFGTSGTLSASAVGGFGNYTYQWTTGQTSSSISVPAGNYCVTVSDSAGCMNTACGVVTEHPLLDVSILGQTLICNGGTAFLQAFPMGGAPPYNVTWSTGATTNNVQVPPGTYTVTVADTSSAGCNASTSVTITQAPPLSATFSMSPTSCFGTSDGQLTVSGSGGTPPYSYYWPASGSTGATLYSLAAGTYTVQVTDNMGCVYSTTGTVTQPTQVVLTLNPVTAATCYGFSDGTAQANASGGSGGYTYYWSPGGSTQALATGLPAGTITAYATDNSGCQASATTTIGQPAQIVMSTPVVTDNPCNGDAAGTATVTASGGTGTFTYFWQETGTSGSTATGLYTGTYTVTATDDSGCQATTTAFIDEPDSLITSIDSFTDITCYNVNDAAISVADTGGTPGYTYTWSPNVSTGPSATGLGPGTYTILISDANGCTDTLTQVVTQPSQFLFVSASAIPASCNSVCDGQVLVIPGGGNAPYTYLWDNGATTAAYVTACAGSYHVEVTDSTGCMIDTTLIVTEPQPLVLTMSSDSAHCFLNDGSASVSVAGGTPGYSYSWNTSPAQSTASAQNLVPGMYAVTVTDDNNCQAVDSIEVFNIPGIDSLSFQYTEPFCNGGCDGTATVTAHGGDAPYQFAWSNGGSNSMAGSLCAGVYSVTVSDNFGCMFTDSVQVTQPAGILVAGAGGDTICVGESATLTAGASGGSGTGYVFNWSNQMIGSSISVNPVTTTDFYVTATDANGCTSVQDTVTVVVNSLIGATAAKDTAICLGVDATLFASATGGNGNYSYSWSPGGMTGTSITVAPTVTTVYVVTISDDCGTPPVQDSATVYVNPLPSVDFNAGSTIGCAPTCVEFDNLTTLNTGNVVNWFWNFGDGQTSTEESPTHCYYTPGSYAVSLTAESDSGCTNTYAFNGNINIYPVPLADFTWSPKEIQSTYPKVYFEDLSTPAQSWTWNFGVPGNATTVSDQNPVFDYPGAGNYCPSLTITDLNGCQDSVIKCLEILPDWTFFVPNAFTPNQDGDNPVFTGYGHNIKDFEMYIYDRWGLLVYYTTDMAGGWDGTYLGKDAPMDVYVYKIGFRDILGTQHFREGHVTLCR